MIPVTVRWACLILMVRVALAILRRTRDGLVFAWSSVVVIYLVKLGLSSDGIEMPIDTMYLWPDRIRDRLTTE